MVTLLLKMKHPIKTKLYFFFTRLYDIGFPVDWIRDLLYNEDLYY